MLTAKNFLLALIESLRLHHWIKNALIFVPLVLGGKTHSGDAWSATIMGLIALGVMTSSSYLVNDVCDLSHDRSHWSKRERPIARGDLSTFAALFVASVGITLSVAIAASIDRWAALMLLAYCALSVTYSVWLKRIPLLDVLILSTLFTFRLLFGTLLADVVASPWLLVFSMFVFTSLSLAKRHSETWRNGMRGEERVAGRGYFTKDCSFLFGLGLATAVAAVLFMALYLIHGIDPTFYSRPVLLWLVPIILSLWLGRVWLLVGRDDLEDDPILFSLTDSASLCLGAGLAIVFLSAWQL